MARAVLIVIAVAVVVSTAAVARPIEVTGPISPLEHPGRSLQQFGTCNCLKKQTIGNCGPLCACLEAQRLPGLPKGQCLPTCLSCDSVLRTSGCPAGGVIPAACIQPMYYKNEVQKCRAVANRRC